MKPAQIASILNDTIMKEQIGTSAPIAEDLSNLVDVGKEVSAALAVGAGAFDNFMGDLIDRIGKVTFVDRVYTSKAPAILKDSWEYGSILMKVRAEVPDFQDNDSWTLAGQSFDAKTGSDIDAPTTIDPFVISKPSASAKIYNSKTTFELPITIAEIQLKEAFGSAAEMNRFISMIQNRIALKATLATDAMVMRTINNLILQKVKANENVVNLLSEYNTATGSTLTAAKAYQDRDFLKFATKTIMMYKKFLANASVRYNHGGYVTFTPEDKLRFTVLADFAKSMEVYLLSETFHNEFVNLSGYTEVPFWQGNGKGAGDTLANRAKITGKIDETAIGGTGTSATAITQNGVVAVMFDDEAAAVCNDNQRVTSIWNPKGEYWNYFYKYDCQYMNDIQENAVVFVIA